MKKFIIKSLLVFVPVATVVGGLNFYIDPANIFTGGKLEKAMADIVVHGGNAMANFSDYDERLFQKYCITQKQGRDEIVVIGSSRVMQIGSEAFPGKKVANNGVSRAVIEDYIGLLELYRNRGAFPQTLLLGVDPWIFKSDHGQKRWMTFKGEVETFNRSVNQRVASGQYSAWPLTSLFWKYEELFSPAYFQQSIKLAIKRIKKGRGNVARSVIATQATEDKDNNIRLADGSYSYNKKYRNKSKSEILTEAIQSASQPVNTCDVIDRELAHRFEQLVQVLISSGSRVVIFLPPYHPVTYDLLNSNDKYKTIEKVEASLRQLGAEHHIPVIGSYDPRKAGFAENDFYDGLHPNREAINKFFTTTRLREE